MLAGPQKRGQRRTHAFEGAVGSDHVAQVVVGGLHGPRQQRLDVAVEWRAVQRGDRLDDDPAGHLAGCVSTHPVGDSQQPRTRVERVLVSLAREADVRARGVTQDEAHLRSSRTVLPIRIGTPSVTGVGVVTRWRSR